MLPAISFLDLRLHAPLYGFIKRLPQGGYVEDMANYFCTAASKPEHS
jgi:hypothetical protein